jgi:hypothetical protein
MCETTLRHITDESDISSVYVTTRTHNFIYECSLGSNSCEDRDKRINYSRRGGGECWWFHLNQVTELVTD